MHGKDCLKYEPSRPSAHCSWLLVDYMLEESMPPMMSVLWLDDYASKDIGFCIPNGIFPVFLKGFLKSFQPLRGLSRVGVV